MPKVAILFFILLFFSMATSSHAFIPVDLKSQNDDKDSLIFDSGIIYIDSDFLLKMILKDI